MSRMSALTTFRLIGSPTKPGWPYCRPCCDCVAWLDAGEILVLGATAGVGEGFCCGAVAAIVTVESMEVAVGTAAASPAAKLCTPHRQMKTRTSVVLMVAF